MPRALIVSIFVLAFLATVRYGLVSWLDRMDPHQPFPYPGDHLGDFKDAVWLPGRDLLAGRDPYDSVAFARAHPATQGYSPYSPSHLILAALFAPLNWSVATAAWTALSATAITIMGLVTGRRLVQVAGWEAVGRARAAGAGLGVIGAWAWRPDAMAIGLGQPTAIYGPAAVLVGLLVGRTVVGRTVPVTGDSRDAPADGQTGGPRWPRGDVSVGVWTALSLGKPQVGLQAVLTLVSVRRWRALGVAVLTTAAACLVVAAILAGGPAHLGGWLAKLPGHLQSAPSRFAVPGDDPWVDVSALTYRAGLRHGAATLIGALLAVALVSGAFLAAARLRRAGRLWLGALALTLGGLSAIPHGVYDALLLYPVVVLAAGEAWRAARPVRPPSSAGSLLAPASPGGTRWSWWGVAAVVLSVCVGAIPNRIPLVRVEPGAVVGVLLLLALACVFAAAANSTRTSPAADSAFSTGAF